jgi:hypothetical protein
MGAGVVYPAGTAKVDVIACEAPGSMVPRLQGNGVVQSPAFETNVRPGGVGSFTTTPSASDGPVFVTAIV